MLLWTHIFDLLAKLAGIAFGVMIAALSAPNPPAKPGMVTLALSCMAAGAIWWMLLRPLSSWLHARVRLGAPLSWAQARRASMLFSPVRDLLHWHPLWEVRQLPVEARVAAIEAVMNQMQSEQNAKDALWRAAPVVSHTLRWLQWTVVAVVVVLTFGNLPPASWVSEFQARRFDGACYPLLTFIILALPVTGVLRWLEHATAPHKVTIVSHSPLDTEAPPSAISPAPSTTPPLEIAQAVDPHDHSRFAPPGLR